MAEPVMQNNFEPLTPEQQAMIQRQAAKSGMNPADLIAMLPALAAGGFGAAGYGIARSGLGRLPSVMIGTGLGAGAGDIMQRTVDRRGATIRDAEGQPGGFYGNGNAPGLADILQGRGQR